MAPDDHLLRSDNLIYMPDISATDASRRFADLLDGVEHRGEQYRIIRRGRVVAELGPAPSLDGAGLKALLARTPPDRSWAEDLSEVRALLATEDRW